MNTLSFEYWTIGGGLILLALLTFVGLWYFFPYHTHLTKFKE